MEYDKSYINKLKSEKQRLVDILNSKGVSSSNDETFTTLAPKIVAIDTGDYFKTVLDDNDSFSGGGSSYYFPELLKKIPSIDLSQVSPSKIDSVNGIFYSCKNATEIGNITLPQGITDLSNMYSYCSLLSSVDISNINMSTVTDISNMFLNCSSITHVDFSNNNLSSITTMSSLFSGCTSLLSVSFPEIQISNLENMAYMYMRCSSLQHIIFPQFPSTNIIDYNYFAYGVSTDSVVFPQTKAKRLSNVLAYSNISGDIDMINISFDELTDFSYAFQHTSAINILGLSNKNYNKLTNMSYMFSYFNESFPNNVSTIDMSNSSFPLVNNISSMFNYSIINNLNLSNSSFPLVNNISSMFNYSIINNLNLSNTQFQSITSATGCFSNATFNTIVGLDDFFNSSELTNLSTSFQYATISNFTTNRINILSKKLTNMTYMFRETTINADTLALGLNLDSDDGNDRVIDINRIFDNTNGEIKTISFYNLGTSNNVKFSMTTWLMDNLDSLTTINFENFDFRVNKGSSFSMVNMSNLESINGIIDLTDYDQNTTTRFSYSSSSLKDIKIKGINSSITFYGDNITSESIDYILNNVADTSLVKPSSLYTIKFNQSVLAKASADAIAHAESLGWTVIAR